jgi:hypothetical protein
VVLTFTSKGQNLWPASNAVCLFKHVRSAGFPSATLSADHHVEKVQALGPKITSGTTTVLYPSGEVELAELWWIPATSTSNAGCKTSSTTQELSNDFQNYAVLAIITQESY